MAHVVTNANDSGPSYTVRWRDRGRFRKRTFKVRREADRFALHVENELAAGQSTEMHVRRGKTVQDCIDECMVIAATKLKPRTVSSYRLGYARHISPVFGSKRISALSSVDVERWVADLHASGLSAATVHNLFVALNKVCRYALRHRYIAVNPCAGTELPKTAHADRFTPQYLTAAEVEQVATVLDAVPPYGLLVRFAAYSGLRAGELAGLRIRDINLMRREVSVVRTLQRIRGEWVASSPKSARSTRTVPILSDQLHADLVVYLGQHPHRADAEAALWPGRAPGSGHPLDYDRRWDSSNFLRWYVKPALQATGLPTTLRLHDLRHTYASLMFAAGVEPYKVSRWMGHANLATTDSIYAHLYLTDHSADAARFAAYLSAESLRPPRVALNQERR